MVEGKSREAFRTCPLCEATCGLRITVATRFMPNTMTSNTNAVPYCTSKGMPGTWVVMT